MADYLAGAVGGLMIGAAAALYLLLNGRIMGASGILGGLVEPPRAESAPTEQAQQHPPAPPNSRPPRAEREAGAERLAFVAGLVLVPAALAQGMAPQTNATSNPILLLLAGLLVGAGTRLANGCTSGHGVCGLSRLSLRGFVATALYLLSGAVVMALGRHVWGGL